MTLHPALRALLWPAAVVFGLVVRLRAWLYRAGFLKQNRLKGVVISVGNLTVGGTGKTPMVMYLAQRLFDRGKKLGILSRGYRGRVRTDARLSPPQAPNSLILSDETWMMERRLGSKVRLGVGANRYSHGRILEAQGIEWFLLDDGFQHLHLYRDVDIVLVDATNPFGGGKLLPAGGLREPKSALGRSDLIVVTRSEHTPAVETIIRRYSQAPIFYARTELDEVYPEEHSKMAADRSEWLGKKMFVFCGIGNASAFVDDVRRWGMEVAGEMVLADHHRYTIEDAAEIERRARAAGAYGLLCTEKDTYNLGDVRFRDFPLFACRATMNLVDAPGFWQTLYDIIERKRGGAP